MFREPIDLGPGRDCAVWRMAWRPSLHPRHCHDDLECNLTLRGRATYLIGEHRLEMTPGTLVWLFPCHEHQLIARDRDHVMDIAVFTPALAAAAATALGDSRLTAADPGFGPMRRLSTVQVKALGWLGQAVEHAAEDPPLANAAGRHLLLAAWRAFHGQAEPVAAALHPAIARTVELLGRSPGATRTALARASGLSPGRLGRVFQAEMGMSLSAFRNRLRVDRFLQVAQSGADCTTAALEAGFGSYSQCHTMVRRLTGNGPRQALGALAPAE
jgi:AraC-like DNA-binding protein